MEILCFWLCDLWCRSMIDEARPTGHDYVPGDDDCFYCFFLQETAHIPNCVHFCEAIFFETSAPVAKDLRRSIAHFADSNLKVNIVQENVGRGRSGD